jgi:hypothetical protein
MVRYIGISLIILFVLAANSVVVAEADDADSVDGWAAPEGSICEGWIFRIAQDMQIHDEDLTAERARWALEGLCQALERTDVEAHILQRNSLKIVDGFLRKNAYLEASEADRQFYKEAYCSWLRKDGFWHD